MSGSGWTDGSGGPNVASCNCSSEATKMGHGVGEANISKVKPSPNVKVSRSRVVTARCAGTVSSSGPSG